MRSVSCALLILLLASSAGTPAHAASSDQPSAIPWLAALPAATHLAGYRLHHQEHHLTCEAASLSMATQGQLSEAKIMAVIPRNNDPWRGFRGHDVDVVQDLAAGLPNYGVYAPPVADAARKLGFQARTFSGPHSVALLKYAISVYHLTPVVWTTWETRPWPTMTASADGQTFTMVEYEHAVTVVGYDARGVYVLDPWDGKLFHPWSQFLAVWQGQFGGMSLVAARSLTDPALRTATARSDGTNGVWSWGGLLPGAVSHVTVYAADRSVATFKLSSATTAESLRFPLAPGVPYHITVRETTPLGLASPLYTSPIIRIAAPTPAPIP